MQSRMDRYNNVSSSDNSTGSRTKRNQDLYEKIKTSDRDSWPVVLDAEDTVVWLPGLKKSKLDKKKTEECDIILKYY